jgi:hypothetical protein
MNRISPSFRFAFLASSLALFVVLALVPASFGQAISGNVVGVVYDPTGAAVANADVEATAIATGVRSTTKTNSTGEYRFNNLSIGDYKVVAKAAGFNAVTREAPVLLNNTTTVNLSLTLGAGSTTVEVSGAAPVIDTTTAQLTSNYDEIAARDLPAVNTSAGGLGAYNLSLLSAGVASPGGVGAGAGPSIGGQRSRNNNFTIEGVDNNNKVVTGPLAIIPNDAVASFTLLENQFSAEFGHSSGGQFNTVVQSGTNTFHGKLYEYFQNRDLNAIDYIVALPAEQVPEVPKNPRYDNNRFGGQFGGPIIKNKLFFFFNYEYNPVGQTASPASPLTPTANGWATLQGLGSGINQNNLAILQKYTPTSTCSGASCKTEMVNGASVEEGVFPIVAGNFINYRNWVVSSDYNIGEHDQLRGRFIYNKSAGADIAAQLPVFFGTEPTISDVFTLGEYHSFSPMLTNEFRLGFNRYYQQIPVGNFSFPGLDQFPNLVFVNENLQLGPDPNGPQGTIQNTYQLVDNVSWTKGKHTLQLGVEGRKYISPQSFTQRSRGDYDYTSFQLYLNDGTPDQLAERSVGPPIYYADQVAFYWYANDNYRIRPNLSLNLGVRYEYTTIPFTERLQRLNSISSVPGLIDFSEPRAPKKNFAPRIGFAWSPGSSGNTSIRGGFGMAYDVLYDNIGSLAKPPQLSQTYDCPGSPTCPAANFLASGAIPPGIAPIPDVATARALTSSWLPVNQKLPYSISWNLGVQRVFLKDYTAEVRYVGTRGVHLDTQNRLNIQSVVTPTNFLPTYLQSPGQAALDALPLNLGTLENGDPLVPAFENAGFNQNFLVGFVPFGDSVYHGLAAQLNRRFSNGLQFQAAYTFSHNIDNSTADFFSTVLTPRRPQDFQNMAAERSNSALDRRHRFTVLAIYDVPFFKHSNYAMRNIVGNWKLSPIYTYESPELATVQAGRDANLNLDSWGDRAILNKGGTPGTGTDVVNLCNSSVPAGHLCNNDPDPNFDPSPYVVAYLANNPNAQYIRTGYGALSNLGRNTLPTQHINNWDFSILKSVSFTERYKFEVGAALQNLFNHPQFTAGYINNVQSANGNYTTATAARNYVTPGKTEFNNVRAGSGIFPSNSRTMSISAKFIF